MGARGRKPLSPEELAARGSRAGLRRPALPEPLPALDQLPPCPKRLKGEARKEWKKVGGILVGARLLTLLDLPLLEDLCALVALRQQAEDEVARDGITIESKIGKIRHPALGIAVKARDQIARIQKEFGMGRASAGRVTIAKPEATAEMDEKEQFFQATG